MHLDEYRHYDLTGLAELISTDELTAGEVQATARQAIEAADADLNAVADGPWDRPLAHAVDGPFAGAPFVVKDLLCHPRGLRTRLGSRLTGDGLPMEHDTFLMDRFRAAGLATMALATAPELGFSGTTEALVHGPTLNPWDRSRSPGGSSGGSAALVAVGAVPAAHANDSGGSIRIPAAVCGLVGLKPSRGRVPVGPDAQEVVFGQLSEFVVTRTVRDTAALLDAVSGPAPGEKAALPRPPRPFTDELDGEVRGLRIGVHTDSWADTSVDPQVRATVERAAEELESRGHRVEPATPDVDWEALISSQVVIWCASLADAVTGIAAGSGLTPSEETLEHVTLATYRRGTELTALDLQAALGVTNRLSRAVGSFFSDWDVLLTPTVNTPAWPLGHLDQNDPDLSPEGWLRRIFDELCTFTPLFNVSGNPAVSLPFGSSGDGLPIGVQLTADIADEATLIQLAAQLEPAFPWSGALPTGHALTGHA